MSIMEYEVKLLIDEPIGSIVEKLTNIGFKKVSTRLEYDYYIDLGSICSLPNEDVVLRIRKVVENNRVRGEITFKGPRLSSEVKLREELSVGVDNPDLAKEIFVRLGFNILKVIKKRLILSRGLEKVFIDDVEGLGSFIEYEVTNIRGIEEFMRYLRKFISESKLKVREVITKSYLELMLSRGSR